MSFSPIDLTRDDIVSKAREWIGTPYHHQASVKGCGCDCLGLVRGVWRELFGFEAEIPPAYSADWAEATGVETLLEASSRHLKEISRSEALSGDVLIFRLRAGSPAKHSAIMTGKDRMIHAIEGAPVSEVHMGRWWRRHIAAVFAFPEID